MDTWTSALLWYFLWATYCAEGCANHAWPTRSMPEAYRRGISTRFDGSPA